MNHVLSELPLVLLLSIAAATDARGRRIPNWLTLLLLAGGIGRSLLRGAPIGPGFALAGVFVAAAIPFGQFTLGAVGAGDVKLMAGVGAWLGPWAGLAVFVIQAVIGGLVAIAQALAERRLAGMLRNTVTVSAAALHVRQLGIDHVRCTGRQVVIESEAGRQSRRLPFAIPVLAAVLLLVAKRGGTL
ncbi:MAG TPA: A24 family peptidase [Tepidisphaeraceae bacterium]